MAAISVQVTITYRKEGTQPPIYLAGSFSEPPWQPDEMTYTIEENGEHTFRKDFKVEPNAEIQYKFRIGPGDWWVLDEDAPIGMILWESAMGSILI
jgi:hypothetical protein